MPYKIGFTNVNADLQTILKKIKGLGKVPISFTIAGTAYQADEGMTWLEWCNSKYNTGGFTCNGDNYNVYASLTSTVINAHNNDGLFGSTIIESNGVYTIVSGGGDN